MLKNHKFNDLNEITVEQLKFRSIKDQTGTATFNAVKVIGRWISEAISMQWLPAVPWRDKRVTTFLEK